MILISRKTALISDKTLVVLPTPCTVLLNARFSSPKYAQIVTDLINRIVQVLRGDLYWVRISARDAELIKPVEP